MDAFDKQVMFAEKSWGNYTVLDVEDESLTIKVNLLSRHRMHYHSHAHRDETWTIVCREERAVLDNAEIEVKSESCLDFLRAVCTPLLLILR